MKKYLVGGILLFFVPVWLALLFIFGQNTAAYLLNSKEKNILALKNTNPDLTGINLPKLYLVQSGSMQPTVGVGSVVVGSPEKTYVNGDIVSFDVQGTGKTIITHRIAYKEFPNGVNSDAVYMTKGDANEDFDTTKISDKNIIGKVRLVIPYLGYLASAAKKPWGFILLVIVPATILIYEELKTIFGEGKRGARKVLGKIKKTDLHSVSLSYPKMSEPDSEGKKGGNGKLFSNLLKTTAYFIPVFGGVLVMTAVSSSFLSDKEQAFGNFFQAASTVDTQPPEVTPTPTVGPVDCSNPKIVINEVYYDVASDKGNDGGADSDEWVELYNTSDCDVDLKDWTLTDNNTTASISHSNKFIVAHGFALISKSASTWSHWTVPSSAEKIEIGVEIGNGLANGGDRVILKNNSAVVVDQMSYGSDTTAYTPASPDVAEGHSLSRNPLGTDTNTAADFVDTNPPTPGV